ncbi:MAG TPA: hypothetical protein VGK44_05555 [Casimicrobiaceae bacterium]|jgi:hypothetical protein
MMVRLDCRRIECEPMDAIVRRQYAAVDAAEIALLGTPTQERWARFAAGAGRTGYRIESMAKWRSRLPDDRDFGAGPKGLL